VKNALRQSAMGVRERKRLLLFALAGAAALFLGFRALAPKTGGAVITRWGYYYILAVFAWFVRHAWTFAASRSETWRGWLRRPGWPAVAIAGAAVFALWSDPFKHKILYDEYVIQGTAFEMHSTKEVSTIIRAYDIGGTWLSIDTFLDKRPFFFPFLISILHDLTGYREANAFILNAVLCLACLGLLYWFASELAGRGPALLSICLMATLPLFGQNASGAGMDLHNLTMIVFVACLGLLYLRRPDENRLSLFVLGAVLLVESRYESVVFLGPVAFVVMAGWFRGGRILLPWAAVIFPLLLVPYALHSRDLSATPLFWQLEEGQTSAFRFANIGNNLQGAWGFLFNTGPGLANSWYLSVLGSGGLGWLLWAGWRRFRTRPRPALEPVHIVALAFGAGVLAHFIVLLFYWWARLDDRMASRFAFPICISFSLLAALLVRALERPRFPALRAGFAGLGIWLVSCGLPAISQRLYTDQNLVMQELDWEHAVVESQPGPVFLITNKSTIPFILWHIPAIITGQGAERAKQIRYHMREGTFREVLVAQALRPTSANGDMGVDPDDVLPDNFRMVTIAEKRFGGRVARISRLLAIDADRTKGPDGSNGAGRAKGAEKRGKMTAAATR